MCQIFSKPERVLNYSNFLITMYCKTYKYCLPSKRLESRLSTRPLTSNVLWGMVSPSLRFSITIFIVIYIIFDPCCFHEKFCSLVCSMTPLDPLPMCMMPRCYYSSVHKAEFIVQWCTKILVQKYVSGAFPNYRRTLITSKQIKVLSYKSPKPQLYGTSVDEGVLSP